MPFENPVTAPGKSGPNFESQSPSLTGKVLAGRLGDVMSIGSTARCFLLVVCILLPSCSESQVGDSPRPSRSVSPSNPAKTSPLPTQGPSEASAVSGKSACASLRELNRLSDRLEDYILFFIKEMKRTDGMSEKAIDRRAKIHRTLGVGIDRITPALNREFTILQHSVPRRSLVDEIALLSEFISSLAYEIRGRPKVLLNDVAMTRVLNKLLEPRVADAEGALSAYSRDQCSLDIQF
jgi:hypothetical protein